MVATYKGLDKSIQVGCGLSENFHVESAGDITAIHNCLDKTEFRVPKSKNSEFDVPMWISVGVVIVGIISALSTDFVQTVISALSGW